MGNRTTSNASLASYEDTENEGEVSISNEKLENLSGGKMWELRSKIIRHKCF